MGGGVTYWSNPGGKNRAAGNTSGEIRIVRMRPLNDDTWFWRTPIGRVRLRAIEQRQLRIAGAQIAVETPASRSHAQLDERAIAGGLLFRWRNRCSSGPSASGEKRTSIVNCAKPASGLRSISRPSARPLNCRKINPINRSPHRLRGGWQPATVLRND
jgi:hypothetical protein